VQGKFFAAGSQRYVLRGVTYGTFRPWGDGNEHQPEIVERDFAAMASANINLVRTYSVPPRWLLDAALRHGLRVLVGLPWEQHVAFLDDHKQCHSIEDSVRRGVQRCSGHTAVLGYTIGNEITSSIVRWHGYRPTERFLQRLYRVAKAEDPDGLVTYVNYPSTEYLQLDFLDFAAFNVYLEARDRFDAYLGRLQNLTGDQPLVIAEIGLDSRRNGQTAQAQALDWQIRGAFAAGCAGVVVFAWTDQWCRGGNDVEDWDFGLTDRARRPKPALAAAQEAFGDVPFSSQEQWPRISVVVCTHNGARTLPDCLEGLRELDYPDFEVIVVDDGSTDGTAQLAGSCGFRVIRTQHEGLGHARNIGLEAASGAIVAYTDDDARPDPQWLRYLAMTFRCSPHAGVGGPNLAPPGDGPIADCVAHAPGGPTHVLLSDHEAEHIPGCNCAFRKSALEAIGGFDTQFRTAGDDVDVCWRLRERGFSLGFSPAAVVWHHRRNSIGAYWRQQVGYGKAEALLERKWPEKYNRAGQAHWSGRLYEPSLARLFRWRRGRIYHGTWGSAPYQSEHQENLSSLVSLVTTPEWYLVVAVLGLLSMLGMLWAPLTLAFPLFAVSMSAAVAHAAIAVHAGFVPGPCTRIGRMRLRTVTALLHLLQPLARLRGRFDNGLTPWRLHGVFGATLPVPRVVRVWSDRWHAAADWLQWIEGTLLVRGVQVRRGGDYDRWDLEVSRGLFGAVALRMAIEEHGAGRQLVRFRVWPRMWGGTALVAALALLAAGAAHDGAWAACCLLGGLAALVVGRAAHECSVATWTLLHAMPTRGAVIAGHGGSALARGQRLGRAA
jgi:GT2 family glycosyltransferase